MEIDMEMIAEESHKKPYVLHIIVLQHLMTHLCRKLLIKDSDLMLIYSQGCLLGLTLVMILSLPLPSSPLSGEAIGKYFGLFEEFNSPSLEMSDKFRWYTVLVQYTVYILEVF